MALHVSPNGFLISHSLYMKTHDTTLLNNHTVKGAALIKRQKKIFWSRIEMLMA